MTGMRSSAERPLVSVLIPKADGLLAGPSQTFHRVQLTENLTQVIAPGAKLERHEWGGDQSIVANHRRRGELMFCGVRLRAPTANNISMTRDISSKCPL